METGMRACLCLCVRACRRGLLCGSVHSCECKGESVACKCFNVTAIYLVYIDGLCLYGCPLKGFVWTRVAAWLCGRICEAVHM